jgi:hypothetical protein
MPTIPATPEGRAHYLYSLLGAFSDPNATELPAALRGRCLLARMGLADPIVTLLATVDHMLAENVLTRALHTMPRHIRMGLEWTHSELRLRRERVLALAPSTPGHTSPST